MLSDLCNIFLSIPSGDAKLFLELFVVLKVASQLLVSDSWCTIWVSALVLTCLLIMHFGSGESIRSGLEVIVKHVEVWVPVDVASGILISDLIATLLHLLLKSLLVGIPNLSIDSACNLKCIHGVMRIIKLVHNAIIHVLVSLLLLVQGISLLEEAFLVKILSVGIFTVLIPARHLSNSLVLLDLWLLLSWNCFLLLILLLEV